MSCAPQCVIFCPTAELPVGPIEQDVGGGSEILSIAIYGTLGFTVTIVTNPQFAVSLLPAILQVRFQGNTLQVTTNGAQAGDEGTYDVVLQVSNCCGDLLIPFQVIVS